MPAGTGSAFGCSRQIARRIGQELLAAAGRAEVVGLAGVLGPVLGGVRVDPHAAHRILHQMLGARLPAVVVICSAMAPTVMVVHAVTLRRISSYRPCDANG